MIAEWLSSQRVLDRVAAGINRLLDENEAARVELRPLAGRVIEIAIPIPQLHLFIAVDESGIVLATRSARPADVVLEGRLTDFMAMAQAHRRGEPVPAGTVRIQGDLATVQQLEVALETLAPDWEDFLARYVGDVPARQISRVIAGLLAWVRQSRASLERDLGEYLLYEAKLTPAPQEVEQLAGGIMRLDADVDRLTARLDRYVRRRIH